MRRALGLLSLALLAGCAADGGFVTKSTIREALDYVNDVDETVKENCCDEDYRIYTPLSPWYRAESQRETVEVRFLWEKATPERSALDIRLVTADGYRRLTKAVVSINGHEVSLRPERRLTHFEGAELMREPCLMPLCAPKNFIFRSGRLFPIDTERLRELAGSDRVSIAIHDEARRIAYGYLPPRNDIARQRRHLTLWLRSVETELNRDPLTFEESPK